MAILSLTRAWSALEEQTTIHVILPNEVQKNQKLQVLWLLHGLGDNGSGWIRKTNLEVLIKIYQSSCDHSGNEPQFLYEFEK